MSFQLLLLLTVVALCYVAVVGYATADVKAMFDSQDELIQVGSRYLSAMMLGTTAAFALHSEHVRRKAKLLGWGIVVMFFTSDMKWNKKTLPDPDDIKKLNINEKKQKRVIFIRHGESLWNEAFNGSKLPHKFSYQVIKALIGEIMMLPLFDSVLFDSPLNAQGFSQAKILSRTLDNYVSKGDKKSEALDDDVAAMRGGHNAPTSVLVSSNLRRAAQTLFVSHWKRLTTTGETVKIISSLQEISRNVDTLVLCHAQKPVPLPGVSECLDLDGAVPLGMQDCVDNKGNKPLFGTGLQRLEEFAEWSFTRDEDVIIAAGHSLWFKHFFNTFLGKSIKTGEDNPASDARDCKVKNGGAVGFNLECGKLADGRTWYRVDNESIEIIEGGFDNAKKQKKAAKKAAKEAKKLKKKQ